MTTTEIRRQRRALDWTEAHFGDSEFLAEWRRYLVEQDELAGGHR